MLLEMQIEIHITFKVGCGAKWLDIGSWQQDLSRTSLGCQTRPKGSSQPWQAVSLWQEREETNCPVAGITVAVAGVITQCTLAIDRFFTGALSFSWQFS